jgi:putative membrane-bound dehydrogenase-like protein
MSLSRFVAGLLLTTVASWALAAAPSASASKDAVGVLPKAADGQTLNLDFETGNLQDWTAVGEAFDGQPNKGELTRGKLAHPQGEYWIGTFERTGDAPRGVLTSAPFKVTHPFAAFLVGGGTQASTRVELVLKANDQVFFKVSGRDQEDMEQAVVDLKPVQGQEVFVRVIDDASGGWGHINFDNFRFYDAKPVAPKAPGSPDSYDHAGLSPQEAADAMILPEGFKCTLFAGEPDVAQPIAMALDDRGRLWIAEDYSYPNRVPDAEARDRILIFEDTNGDGKFDKRTVFAEKLNLVSGIAVGHGGVFVGAAPYLMFIPDANGDDRPDGPPEVLLDGWAWQDTHETLNTFIWGPDGWLYGCHGVFTHSNVGKPGTPDNERQPLNCAIWRFHPTRHEFEIFAHGTSNPWGVDFNDYGAAVSTACVIPHMYYIIQGGRYERQGGEHFNRFTFEDIKTIADHRHYAGGNGPHGGNGRSDSAGGGHAHAGAMIYLGGAWPAEYRGEIFMNNIHGQRINMDLLKQKGSGYVASHGPDFCMANDSWSQILNLRYGPDGQAYMIDWYDKQACHDGNLDRHDRANGRIFKITYGEPKAAAVDLAKETDEQLAQRMLEANDWYVRHARRLLAERATKGAVKPEAIASLKKIALENSDDTRRLRGLWALHAVGALDGELTRKFLDDKSPYVRAWAIQLDGDDPKRSIEPATLTRLEQLAASDPSPVVRLYLASRLQRLPAEQRWNTLAALASHSDDAGDHNLPDMYWYVLEPLLDKDAPRAMKLAADGQIPQLLKFSVRKLGLIGTPEAIDLVIATLGNQTAADRQLSMLEALNSSFQGRREVPAPPSWSTAFDRLRKTDNPAVRLQLEALAVTLGDASVLAELRKVVKDTKADAKLRSDALASLLKARDRELPAILRGLLRDPVLAGGALRGMAEYSDPENAKLILEVFDSLQPAERRDALATLCSHVEYARVLMAALIAKRVPATDLSADLVRQLRNLNDESITTQITSLWGTSRDSAEDKKRMMADVKRTVEGQGSPADVNLGRAVFAKTCQQCHTLFSTGGKIGPDLTGSNRANLDYLLSNVIDPSAVLVKEYTPSIIETEDGRIVTGIIKAQDDQSVTVQTPTELLVLPRAEIAKTRASELSMMPDNLLVQLSPDQVRGLVAYLASPQQAPILATPENVTGFFNGKDLTGWYGTDGLWSVENGEIVGKTPGLGKNEFLKSDMILGDFRLKVEVKLVGNEGNSGIQIRSQAMPEGEVKGYQADIGAGWWGKLYEELGRGILNDKSGEEFVKPGEWNSYEIVCSGNRTRTWINGHLCTDLDDSLGAKRGIVAVQLHSGGKTEVRFRDIKLELDPKNLEP